MAYKWRMLTPAEARNLSQESKHLKSAQRTLDKHLKEHAKDGEWPARISVDLFTHEQRTMMNELVGMYARAGWKISYRPDARDGDFLEIERP